MSRQSYHHGNLRNELIDLATAELEHKGRTGISLRDLAARLGVARSAPYRHFTSLDDLLAAVALNAVKHIRQGFLDVLASSGSPREQLRQACRSYLDFAASRPVLYRLIFDPDISRHIDIRLEEQPEASFGIFLTIIGNAAGIDDPAELHDLGVATWAIVHGYAMLRMNPGINVKGFVDSAEEMLLSLTTSIAEAR